MPIKKLIVPAGDVSYVLGSHTGATVTVTLSQHGVLLKSWTETPGIVATRYTHPLPVELKQFDNLVLRFEIGPYGYDVAV